MAAPDTATAYAAVINTLVSSYTAARGSFEPRILETLDIDVPMRHYGKRSTYCSTMLMALLDLRFYAKNCRGGASSLMDPAAFIVSRLDDRNKARATNPDPLTSQS
jgi:protein involved in sex pheromone biosynthesis